jgi:hypothetical protein
MFGLQRMPSSQDLKLDTTDLPTDLQVEALQMAIENIEQDVCNSDEVLNSEVLFCDSVFALPKFEVQLPGTICNCKIELCKLSLPSLLYSSKFSTSLQI